MSIRIVLICAALAAACSAGAAPAPVLRDAADLRCADDSFALLVLGSFHMDSPGQDQHNLDPGNMLSATRQRQIEAVIAKIARFAPNRIALESPLVGSRLPERYAQYRAGEYPLTRNEIDQIGLRLAGRLGLPSVDPVDFAMWMDGRVPAEIGTPAPRPETAGAAQATGAASPLPAVVADLQRVITEGSVLEALQLANRWDHVRDDHALYIASLRPDPYSDALYGNTDPVANWYKRNLRIFTNIYRIAKPGDRVLLLIGAGHGAILRQLAIDAPDVCLADASAYLR